MKKYNLGRNLGFPVLVFILYFVFSYFIVSATNLGIITGSFVIDGGFALTLGAFAIWEKLSHPEDRKREKLHFSVFGWLVIFTVFGLMYFFSECVGNYILSFTYEEGSTAYYADMSGKELYMYILLGVSIGPIAEELIFRWMMFHRFRNFCSFWPAWAVSTFFFTLSHGTWMHVPVTVGLSLFLCLFYEMTGQFRYCMLFHILFNFMAVAYAMNTYLSIPVIMTGYGLTMAILVLGVIFRDKVFHKYLKLGGVEQLEQYLDEQRKKFGQTQDDSEEK